MPKLRVSHNAGGITTASPINTIETTTLGSDPGLFIYIIFINFKIW